MTVKSDAHAQGEIDRHLKTLRKAEIEKAYYENPKACENQKCNNVLSFTQSRGAIRFCSRSCSCAVVVRLQKSESRDSVSKSLKKHHNTECVIERCCAKCAKIFRPRKHEIEQPYCSNKCAGVKKTFTTATRAKISATIRAKVAAGTHKGWQARTLQPSYPEKYFIALFDNECISDFEREKKVGKWFIDFAFESKMIAVEVDGSQHDLAERKESDRAKDEYLASLGWTVFRIRWCNPVNEKNKNLLYSQIEKMKELLRSKECAYVTPLLKSRCHPRCTIHGQLLVRS